MAQAIVATWNCQDKIPQQRSKARSPWKHHTRGYWARELNLWTTRLASCRAVLTERARQWNWQAWLPPHWYRVGSCETGYGGDPNWHHNSGAYQGAFGFAVSSWDAFRLPGYPSEAYLASPWQQYQVALAIYRRYGMSGWGCKG